MDNTLSDNRVRNKNWTENETYLFLELIEPNYNKLFGKFSSSTTLQDKHQIWQEISTKLPSRSVDELKRKLSKLKSTHVKCYSDYKKQLNKTGGGPPPEEPSNITMKVLSLLGGENNPRISGLGTGMDSSDLTDLNESNEETSSPFIPASKPPTCIKRKLDTIEKAPPSKRSHVEEQILEHNEREHELRMQLLALQIENERKRGVLLDEQIGNVSSFVQEGDSTFLNL